MSTPPRAKTKPKKWQPIENWRWRAASELTANDYNPNVVYTPEMRLLEFSLLKTGWIQPILITTTGVIIDGFHRVTLVKTSKALAAMTDGMVPVVELELSESERMLLTIRINRAKGSHIAIRMHDLVTRLVQVEGLEPEYVATSIGATKEEIDLLLQEGVFQALKIGQHQYSRAWEPR